MTTDPTMLDFEQLCRWKAERRYNDLHLKLLGIELVRLDCCEHRLHDTEWAARELERINQRGRRTTD